jgi:hypothetical protein
MDCVAASQASNHEFSQEKNAVTGRPLGLDCGPAPNDECGDYESDNTRQCSPPSTMFTHIAIKNMSRTDSRQHNDHNARHAGNQPLCCCCDSVCDDVSI